MVEILSVVVTVSGLHSSITNDNQTQSNYSTLTCHLSARRHKNQRKFESNKKVLILKFKTIGIKPGFNLIDIKDQLCRVSPIHQQRSFNASCHCQVKQSSPIDGIFLEGIHINIAALNVAQKFNYILCCPRINRSQLEKFINTLTTWTCIGNSQLSCLKQNISNIFKSKNI